MSWHELLHFSPPPFFFQLRIGICILQQDLTSNYIPLRVVSNLFSGYRDSDRRADGGHRSTVYSRVFFQNWQGKALLEVLEETSWQARGKDIPMM